MYILHTHLRMYSNSTTNRYSTNYNIYTVHTHVQLYSTTYCTCILYSDTVDIHTVLRKCTHEYSTTSAAAHHTQYGILPGGCLPHGGDAGLLLVTH